MANFFTDNPDLLHHLRHADLRTVVDLMEDGFTQAETYDYAPADYEDALDNYSKMLEVLGELSAEEMAALAEDVDRAGCTLEEGRVAYAPGTQHCLQRLKQAGLMGFTLPRRWGGLNMPAFVHSMAVEIVSRGDASLMNLFGLQGIAETINAYGSDEQKERYLSRFAAGEITGAMAFTEPDAGSDLGAVRLKAIEGEGGAWRLFGVKRFITNGCADVLLVLGRSEPGTHDARGLSLFICERSPQVRIRRIEDKLGIHGSPTCEIVFDEAPAELLGRRRFGLVKYVMSLLNGARLAVAAQAVGIAQAAYSEALEFARAREQFGKAIVHFPAVRERLGEMSLKIRSARALVFNTARLVDLHSSIEEAREDGRLVRRPDAEQLQSQLRPLSKLTGCLTPIAKYYAAEIANQVAYDAISVLGGSGYMRDCSVERYYRDARITSIYEGTAEIQVAAAVGGIMRGILEEEFVRLHEHLPSDDALLQSLLEARRLLAKAIEHLREAPQDYVDLSSRRLVDMATDIYVGYLLVQDSRHEDAKRVLAGKHISDALLRAKTRCETILKDDRTYLDKPAEALGCSDVSEADEGEEPKG